jgi:hypothetical protein
MTLLCEPRHSPDGREVLIPTLPARSWVRVLALAPSLYTPKNSSIELLGGLSNPTSLILYDFAFVFLLFFTVVCEPMLVARSAGDALWTVMLCVFLISFLTRFSSSLLGSTLLYLLDVAKLLPPFPSTFYLSFTLIYSFILWVQVLFRMEAMVILLLITTIVTWYVSTKCKELQRMEG